MGRECCGRTRAGRYCPNCGVHLGVGDLNSLRTYLEGQRNRCVGYVSKVDSLVPPHPVRAKQAKECLAKWQGWLNTLDSLVSQAAHGT